MLAVQGLAPRDRAGDLRRAAAAAHDRRHAPAGWAWRCSCAAPATPARTASSCCFRARRRARAVGRADAVAAPSPPGWPRATRCAWRRASTCTATTSRSSAARSRRASAGAVAEDTGFIGSDAVRAARGGPRGKARRVHARRSRHRAPGQPRRRRRRGHERHALALPGGRHRPRLRARRARRRRHAPRDRRARALARHVVHAKPFVPKKA